MEMHGGSLFRILFDFILNKTVNLRTDLEPRTTADVASSFFLIRRIRSAHLYNLNEPSSSSSSRAQPASLSR